MPIDIAGNVISTASLSTSLGFANTVLQDGLVLHLDAANKNSYVGSGTTWSDLSGNGNTATLINGPTFNSSNGGSIVFDGSNDYAEVSTSTGLGLGGGSVGTLMCWLRAEQKGAFQYIAGLRDDGDFDFFFLLLDSGGGSVLTEARLRTVDGIWDINVEYISYFNTWTHIAFLCETTRTQLYINGKLVGQNTNKTGNFGAGSNNFRIGTNGNSPAFYAQGRIANVMLYNRALHRAEILANYYATKDRF